MNTQNANAWEIIHQNGVGQDVRVYFSTENTKNNSDYMSKVNNYKYNNIIKLSLDRSDFNQHEKNLVQCPNCELLIKKGKDKHSVDVRLFCKFLKVENRFIYIRILNIEYKYREKDKEIAEKISVNEK